MEALLAKLVPYKDLFIIAGILLVLSGAYLKGYHDANVANDAANSKANMAITQGYITGVTKLELKNDNEYNTNIDAIKNDKAADGPVSPVLHHALDKLRH